MGYRSARNGEDPERYNVLVARLTADGQADTGFARNGRQESLFPGNSRAHELAVQSEGKIVLAGGSSASTMTLA